MPAWTAHESILISEVALETKISGPQANLRQHPEGQGAYKAGNVLHLMHNILHLMHTSLQ